MLTITRNLAAKAAAFLAGLLLLAVLLEAGLRLLGRGYSVGLPEARGSGYTIICLGDSFTYGTTVPAELSYPAQLETVLREKFPGRDIKVVNLGEVAQNTAQLLERLPTALDRLRPDAVVIMSGMANYWNYWGYRTGRQEPRRNWLDRLRVARLVKLLLRDAARARAASKPAAKPADACRELPEHRECWRLTRLGAPPDKILFACRAAAEKCPQDIDSVKNTAFTYLNTFRRKEAIEWFRRAIDLDPSDPPSYVGISNALGADSEEAGKWRRLGAERAGGATAELRSGELDIPAWIRFDLGMALDLIREAGARAALQSYPGRETSDATGASEALRGLAAERALPFTDQAAVFAGLLAKGRREDYFAYRDPHCSARGYRVMAEQLAATMEKAGFFAGLPNEPARAQLSR